MSIWTRVKDLERRLKEAEQVIVQHKKEHYALEAQHSALLKAFDAWFDLVAPELGFEAKQAYCFTIASPYGIGLSEMERQMVRTHHPPSSPSPRVAAEVITPNVIKRVPAKMCEGKSKRRKSNAR